MNVADNKEIIAEYLNYIQQKEFPCIAAKAAAAREKVSCFVAGHMACPKDDASILQFLYEFIDKYRASDELYHTAAILFTAPTSLSEAEFEQYLWMRLQA